MDQVIQVFGSLLVLAAFAAAQRDMLSQTSRLYLGLNVAGSAILAVLAARGHQWGFLLLEGSWALVSAAGLLRPRDPARREADGRSSPAPSPRA